MKKGYEIIIVGTSSVKDVMFMEDKPSESQLKELIIENKGVKAFIKEVEMVSIQ